jgi:uncharacterized protein involved in outer membrane biogenesis
MSKSLKIILFTVGGLVGLLVLVAVALILFVDADAYKPRLEARASEALGMEVSVGGRLAIGFFPGLLATLGDVHVRNREAEVASAKEARLGIDLLPLLQGEVRIARIALKHARISIERSRDGRFNFEKMEATEGTLPALDLAKVSLSDGSLRYADQQSGEGFEAGDCSLEGRDLRLLSGKGSDLMKNLSLTAELACREVRDSGFTVSELKVSADGKNGAFDLKPVTIRLFGAQGSGSIRADFSGAVPLYNFQYSLQQFRAEEFFKTLSPQKVAEGPMDFSANLSMRGKTVKEMTRTAEGEISLRGKDLTLSGSNLDLELSRFESSQNFNLVDVGAFFVAGPLGLVVTKGYDFASIFRGSGDSSRVRTLVSDWKVERGVAHAQDVAMATNENRVAFHGGLDFVNARFDNATMAVIDAGGCAKVLQKLRGTFQKPVVERPGILKSLTGPALKLLKKGRDFLPGGECEVFYSGSVAPPK